MINALKKLATEGPYFTIIKATDDRATANTTQNGKN
jgi:hypothetical protein